MCKKQIYKSKNGAAVVYNYAEALSIYNKCHNLILMRSLKLFSDEME